MTLPLWRHWRLHQGTTLALGENPSAAFPNGLLCDLLYFVTANADSFDA